MKIIIDSDELYPYYSIGNWGEEVEAPDDLVERWRQVTSAWVDVQLELAKLVDGENPWGR